MMFKPSHLLLALAAVSALPVSAQTVATVNGKAITKANVDAFVKQAASQGRPDTPELRKYITNELIGREVLIQEADRQGISTRADLKAELENARQQVTINAMLSDYLKKNPVDDAAIKAAYDKYKAQAGDTEYHARHILVKTDAEAKAIITKLKGGAKFEELAKGTLDGSASNGGDLGWATRATYVKPFADAMAALKVGKYTETPVESQFGFHVIKLEETRPAKVKTLEELKPRIAEGLQQEKLAAYRDELRKKAKVQ